MNSLLFWSSTPKAVFFSLRQYSPGASNAKLLYLALSPVGTLVFLVSNRREGTVTEGF